ncbi:MAG: hypothetical protein KU38_06650 [Sulfurovum sp. FS08-3]|nr:MAG: hypothetical protein KU38_06650 [Sulfurovum sp. FS08-3]
MTKAFEEQIKNFPHPLFYNTTGSPIAYKLGIRHLSAAPLSGLATLSNVGHIYPKAPIYLVDLEAQTIEEIGDCIKLIRLQSES